MKLQPDVRRCKFNFGFKQEVIVVGKVSKAISHVPIVSIFSIKVHFDTATTISLD